MKTINSQMPISLDGIASITSTISEGSSIKLTYVNDKEITFGPRTRKNITNENDLALSEHIAKLPEGYFKDALVEFQKSDKYVSALKNGKTAPLIFNEDAHIVKVSAIDVNWMTNDGLANAYKKFSEDVKALRIKHGFGQLVESYKEGDWHFNYNGIGAEPEHKTGVGNPYKSIGSSLYQNDKETIAFRQMPISSKVVCWLFFDGEGHMEAIDNETMSWFAGAYVSPKPSKEVTYLNEEKAYVDDYNALKSTFGHEVTLTLANVLCISENKEGGLAYGNYANIANDKPYLTHDVCDEIVAKID